MIIRSTMHLQLFLLLRFVAYLQLCGYISSYLIVTSKNTQDFKFRNWREQKYWGSSIDEFNESIKIYHTKKQSAHIFGSGNPHHEPTMLQKIVEQRYIDLEIAEEKKSSEALRVQLIHFDELYGPPLNLYDVVSSKYPDMAVAAEFKRSSPSKGDIAPNLVAREQGLRYASAGASVISVLTEPSWFKGSLNDMKDIRISTQLEAEQNGIPRPAILRKDFIIDEYMILEARAYGADTVLLIVSILEVDQLHRLMAFSRAQGMEPLVEVHTEQEMSLALDADAKVIGVNNRNLHTFHLDMGATERASKIATQRNMRWGHNGDFQLAALSGISTLKDVSAFRSIGVSMVLVGEALMRSTDPAKEIKAMIHNKHSFQLEKVVKICGVTNEDDALIAARAGANMIGIIFAESSKRSISLSKAKDIVNIVRAFGERSDRVLFSNPDVQSSSEWFQQWAKMITEKSKRMPLVVGVFQNQPLSLINTIVHDVGLDMVQLHGNEDWEICKQIPVPSIRVLHVDSNAAEVKNLYEVKPSFASLILLDTCVLDTFGGTGITFDHQIAVKFKEMSVPVLIAGGLNDENVIDALKVSGAWGVDVCSGVEKDGCIGQKDKRLVTSIIEKIKNS